MRGRGYGAGLRPHLDRCRRRRPLRRRASVRSPSPAGARVLKTLPVALARRGAQTDALAQRGRPARSAGLDLSLGHFRTHHGFWVCASCEGWRFQSHRPCEECCGTGWALLSDCWPSEPLQVFR